MGSGHRNYSLDDKWKKQASEILAAQKNGNPAGTKKTVSQPSGILSVISDTDEGKIESLEQYVRRVTSFGQDSNSDGQGIFWYRGQASIKFQLVPSVYRKNSAQEFIHTYHDEFNLLSYFKSYAYPFIKADRPQNDLEWLILAQHFGLPTRLMDFTIDPLIALAFALEIDKINQDESHRNDSEDAVVYVFRPLDYNLTVPNPPNGIPHLTELGDKQSGYVPSLTESDTDKPIACISIFNNDNISAQKGTFVLFSRLESKRVMSLRDIVQDNYILSEIVISAAKKAEIRDHLYQIGYNISRLYPNLNSVAADIKFVNSKQNDVKLK
ncbi:FRG domain-containing protein (plasmid) [Alicyclobacillus acidoterrestris]|uniref:FRG domain-containing protein n=1 Tax=Alicyclobacillus acidoterrestris TaxID=1450 RepID=UPI003F52AB9F